MWAGYCNHHIINSHENKYGRISKTIWDSGHDLVALTNELQTNGCLLGASGQIDARLIFRTAKNTIKIDMALFGMCIIYLIVT